MATIAVTGANGFIGRQLVAEHLQRGDRVRVLTRKPAAVSSVGAEICVGDLTDAILPPDFPGEADILYHCAAELRDRRQMWEVNFLGTQRLMRAATGRVGRWVQLSSVGVYGQRATGAITEEASLQPHDGYELSKAKADEVILEAVARGSIACSILRPSNVFGPGMSNRSLFQLAAMMRRRLLFFVGPPGALANYIHVDNVVAALRLCATHEAAAGRIFNLSDCVAMEYFIEAIARAMEVPVPRLRLPLKPISMIARVAGLLPGSPLTVSRIDALSRRCYYPTDRIESELGYRHRLDLETSIRETFRCYAGS